MINGLKHNHSDLWYRLWQGWGWAFNLFFGFIITLLLAAVVTYSVANDWIYQVARYLAQSPTMTGLPYQWRLAIMGGGLFIVLAFVMSIVELIRYFYIRPNRITHQDLDIQLTAIMLDLQRIKDKVGNL